MKGEIVSGKVEFSLEKYRAQAKLPKVKTPKEKKLKFWQLPISTNGKKKKSPKYYKRQLYKIGKDLV